jgi:hypothetical protein
MKRNYQAIVVSVAMLAVPLSSWAQNEVAAGGGTETAQSPTQQGGQMKVVCKGDQLTISANGSPLSSILSEVGRCSGAKIDGADAAGKMRFFETIGPAPIQDVLSSLLDASGINYVIQVSDSNPRKIATVLLLARADRVSSGDSPDDPSLSASRRAFLKQMRQNSRDIEEASPANDPAANAEGSAAETLSGNNPEPVPTPLEPPPATTARIPSPTSDSAPASSQMNLQDRITDMQRMFEQRKQMVQGQSSHPH